eukprot:GHVU01212223.1.p7 GENE.GHVU01212223.1~~GHVU01212223.1.p7  ORF type:complete len:102 (+),score=12.01 GHVU01212223.1:384-689(+)
MRGGGGGGRTHACTHAHTHTCMYTCAYTYTHMYMRISDRTLTWMGVNAGVRACMREGGRGVCSPKDWLPVNRSNGSDTHSTHTRHTHTHTHTHDTHTHTRH